MSNNKYLADLLKVCSILPALVIMPAMAADYTSSDIEQYPYTVKAGDSLSVTKGYSNAENGVFHNNGSLIVGDDLVFIDNNTDGYGATIYLYNKNATYTKIGNNVVFTGGTALEGTSPDYDGMGGAIYSWSDGGKDGASGANVIEMGNNVTFRGNSAVDGSVMYTYGYNNITIGDNLVVEGNSATGGYGAFVLNGYDSFNGNDFINTMNVGKNALFKNNSALLRSGAVYIGGDANDKAVFGDGARFVGNRSSYGGAVAGFGTFEFGDVSFESNVSFNAWEQVLKDAGWSAGFNGHIGNGGAVLNRGGFSIDGNANFLTNKADSDGGAIYNGGDMSIAQSAFNGNIAGLNGGAIYNYGTMDLGEAGSVFEDNVASIEGGAIYNTGDLTIENGDFENNRITSGNGDGGALYTNTGALTLVDTDFSENYTCENAEGDLGYGGAIFAQGGTIDIQGGEYEDNHALTGGAIYVSGKATSVNIENVEFEGNWASDIGALGIFGKNVTLTNLMFTDNYTTGQYKDFGFNDGGGALFFGAAAQAVLDNGTFVSNKSAGVGGAIATRSPDKGDNSAAKLDIKNSTFRENVAATQGGAIYTAFHNSKEAIDNVYLADSVFVANKANEGGAIYNEGLADRGNNFASIYMTGVTFKDNVATEKGGAVFNGAGGTINLSGMNEFSGNVAHGLANDIHNLGTINITDGTTTFGGGVDGMTGTFNLAQGATLDLGTATIRQGTIDLQGTVIASMLNDSVRGGTYGRFIGDVTVGENAAFQLNVGAVGTYNIWDGLIVDADKVSVGDIYEIADIDANGVKIVTKSVDAIAEQVGISTQAAGAVAGLANAKNGKAHQVSLALQEALNSGDIEYVEQETDKLNPDDKPVAQAAASAIQNQVLSLTSGRMAGGIAVGRAGGDEATQENGFWMQGLFNKSKFADKFHGYTRGVALGADTLIDNKWTVGGGLAFNNSDVHTNQSRHTDIDSKTLFLYGQYKPNKWYANATLTYNMSEYTESKTVAGVDFSSTYDVDSYGAQLMTGYDFATGVTTEVGARYLHIAQDGYVGEDDAQISSLDTDFLSGVAGVKYAFAIENDWEMKLRPELRAAMTYDIISDDAQATVVLPSVASYKVATDRLSRMGGEFGIGLTALYRGLEVSVMYDLDLHKDYTSQTGMIKFRTQF